MKNRKFDIARSRAKLFPIFLATALVIFGVTGSAINAQSADSSQQQISARKMARILADGPIAPKKAPASRSQEMAAPQSAEANPLLYAYNFFDNHLISFNANAPDVVLSDVLLTGFLNTDEYLEGIDFRPSDGRLYAVATDDISSRVVVINTTTGAITSVGGTVAPVSGLFRAIDINPAVDALREISDADDNRRLNLSTGALISTDTKLAYAAADVNFGKDPSVVHTAYSNNTPGATTTTLYGIDSGTDALVTIGSLGGSPTSPNSGNVFTVGSLGINTSSFGGFDIQQGTGVGYAILRVSSVPQLYRINIATGAATLLGTVGNGSDPYDGLSIAMGAAGAASADLAITKTNGTANYTAGGTTTYTITVSNAGPDPVVGATIADTFPTGLTAGNWTCTASAGSSCSAVSGSGNIAAKADILSGGTVTYTVAAAIAAGTTGSLANTATVAAPAGVTDPNTANNTATDTDTAAAASGPVTISGKVVGPTGLGVKGAVVTLTDANNVKRTVNTNDSGFYRFDDVQAGPPYTVSAVSKKYTYTSQTVTPNNDLSNVNFTGTPTP